MERDLGQSSASAGPKQFVITTPLPSLVPGVTTVELSLQLTEAVQRTAPEEFANQNFSARIYKSKSSSSGYITCSIMVTFFLVTLFRHYWTLLDTTGKLYDTHYRDTIRHYWPI